MAAATTTTTTATTASMAAAIAALPPWVPMAALDIALGKLIQRTTAYIEQFWDYSDTMMGAHGLDGRSLNVGIIDGTVHVSVNGARPLPSPEVYDASAYKALIELINSEVTALWNDAMEPYMGASLFGGAGRAGADWAKLFIISFDTAPGERCHEGTVQVRVTNPVLAADMMRAFDRSGRGAPYFKDIVARGKKRSAARAKASPEKKARPTPS